MHRYTSRLLSKNTEIELGQVSASMHYS